MNGEQKAKDGGQKGGCELRKDTSERENSYLGVAGTWRTTKDFLFQPRQPQGSGKGVKKMQGRNEVLLGAMAAYGGERWPLVRSEHMSKNMQQ